MRINLAMMIHLQAQVDKKIKYNSVLKYYDVSFDSKDDYCALDSTDFLE